MVKRGCVMAKRYRVLFTCLTMRVVQSMETDSFIISLQRFMARHEKPEEMRSDNGTNFKGGNREFTETIKDWNHNKLNAFFFKKKYDGILIPHMPLIWVVPGVRPIRTVRMVLSGLLKEQVLDEECSNTPL